jgi:hypothetical protein
MAQLSATKAIFHTNARLSDRLDKIENRQVCADGFSDGVQHELRSLRAELQDVLAVCRLALKPATSTGEYHYLPKEDSHVSREDAGQARGSEHKSCTASQDGEMKAGADFLLGNLEQVSGVDTSITNSVASSSNRQCGLVKEDPEIIFGEYFRNSERTAHDPAMLGESRQQPAGKQSPRYLKHQSVQSSMELVAQFVLQEKGINSEFERHEVCVSLCQASDVEPFKVEEAISLRKNAQTPWTAEKSIASEDACQESRIRDADGSISSKPHLHSNSQGSRSSPKRFTEETITLEPPIPSPLIRRVLNNLNSDSFSLRQSSPIAAEAQDTPAQQWTIAEQSDQDEAYDISLSTVSGAFQHGSGFAAF